MHYSFYNSEDADEANIEPWFVEGNGKHVLADLYKSKCQLMDTMVDNF